MQGALREAGVVFDCHALAGLDAWMICSHTTTVMILCMTSSVSI